MFLERMPELIITQVQVFGGNTLVETRVFKGVCKQFSRIFTFRVLLAEGPVPHTDPSTGK